MHLPATLPSPKPKYKPNTLPERLTSDVESLIDTHPTATLYLTGDFNHLNISQFLSETGLQQIVTEATRSINTLDLFITNRPDQAQCHVAMLPSRVCRLTTVRCLLTVLYPILCHLLLILVPYIVLSAL